MVYRVKRFFEIEVNHVAWLFSGLQGGPVIYAGEKLCGCGSGGEEAVLVVGEEALGLQIGEETICN